MRIITGQYGGRVITAPKGHKTHPMSEKIRGAIFNALGNITGLSVLDAYAGSGAIAIEAVSRGAATAAAIDNDRNAVHSIKQNTKALSIDNIKVTQAPINTWAEASSHDYDIVIADPPYDDVKPGALVKVANLARRSGIVVFSLPPTTKFELPSSEYEFISQKDYGDASLVFYRRRM